MVALRTCSAFLCFALFGRLGSPNSLFDEWPSLSTYRLLIGASSLPSSCRTVESQVSSALGVHAKEGRRFIHHRLPLPLVYKGISFCISPPSDRRRCFRIWVRYCSQTRDFLLSALADAA